MTTATMIGCPSLREFVHVSGLRSVVMGASKDPNAKIAIVLVAPGTGEPLLAVKVPTTDVAAAAIAAEARMLAGLARLGAGFADTIPRVVGSVEFRGRVGLVTTAMRGTPMTTTCMRWRHTASPLRVAADFAAVGEWLAAFQARTAGPPAPLDMDAGVAAGLARRFADDAVAEDLERLAEVHARLGGAVAPRTAVHGDLWCGNVTVHNGRAAGVYDWEAGAASGEPVRDLVRFAHMYALFLDRRTRPGRRVAGHRGLRAGDWGAPVEVALYGTGWFAEQFRRFLQRGLGRLGVSPARWRDAALAGIAEVAALTDDEGFARSHLDLFRRTVRRQAPGCAGGSTSAASRVGRRKAARPEGGLL